MLRQELSGTPKARSEGIKDFTPRERSELYEKGYKYGPKDKGYSEWKNIVKEHGPATLISKIISSVEVNGRDSYTQYATDFARYAPSDTVNYFITGVLSKVAAVSNVEFDPSPLIGNALSKIISHMKNTLVTRDQRYAQVFSCEYNNLKSQPTRDNLLGFFMEIGDHYYGVKDISQARCTTNTQPQAQTSTQALTPPAQTSANPLNPEDGLDDLLAGSNKMIKLFSIPYQIGSMVNFKLKGKKQEGEITEIDKDKLGTYFTVVPINSKPTDKQKKPVKLRPSELIHEKTIHRKPSLSQVPPLPKSQSIYHVDVHQEGVNQTQNTGDWQLQHQDKSNYNEPGLDRKMVEGKMPQRDTELN
jgi:hypothetical protein